MVSDMPFHMRLLSSQLTLIACSQAVEFYLDAKYTKERETIIELVNLKKPSNDARVLNYIQLLQRQCPGDVVSSADD